MVNKKFRIVEPLLITGTNGFLGSHLAQFFIQNNTKIYGIYRGTSWNPNVEKIHDDILSINKMPDDISTILHFAALTDIGICEKNPEQCFDVNVKGTKNMLELARKHDSQLIFASSSHVYGKPKSLPIDENFSLNPLSIHGQSKVQAENLCEEYAKLYGLKITIIRTFSIYGPRSPQYSIISRIINQIIKNQNIVLGNLQSKRDFLYVSDFLSAINILINKKFSGCSKINIGLGESFSIEEVSQKLLKISNKTLNIKSDPNLIRKNDVDELVCDNSKLKKLGWKPQFTFDEGLELVYRWFESNFSR